jgi:hypothetical protein
MGRETILIYYLASTQIKTFIQVFFKENPDFAFHPQESPFIPPEIIKIQRDGKPRVLLKTAEVPANSHQSLKLRHYYQS